MLNQGGAANVQSGMQHLWRKNSQQYTGSGQVTDDGDEGTPAFTLPAFAILFAFPLTLLSEGISIWGSL